MGPDCSSEWRFWDCGWRFWTADGLLAGRILHTLLTLVVALGVAVYLNWEYAKSTDLALDAAEANAR